MIDLFLTLTMFLMSLIIGEWVKLLLFDSEWVEIQALWSKCSGMVKSFVVRSCIVSKSGVFGSFVASQSKGQDIGL